MFRVLPERKRITRATPTKTRLGPEGRALTSILPLHQEEPTEALLSVASSSALQRILLGANVTGYSYLSMRSDAMMPLAVTVGTPPPGWTELPTRYRCLMALDLALGRNTVSERMSCCRS